MNGNCKNKINKNENGIIRDTEKATNFVEYHELNGDRNHQKINKIKSKCKIFKIDLHHNLSIKDSTIIEFNWTYEEKE